MLRQLSRWLATTPEGREAARRRRRAESEAAWDRMCQIEHAREDIERARAEFAAGLIEREWMEQDIADAQRTLDRLDA